jgi:hypothetical protein
MQAAVAASGAIKEAAEEIEEQRREEQERLARSTEQLVLDANAHRTESLTTYEGRLATFRHVLRSAI